MQLNAYPLNNINKTVKGTLQIHNSEHKSKELELLKMFIPYEKGAAEKLKRVASEYAFTTAFTKNKRLKRTKVMFNENLEKSRVVYEVDPNNCLKKYAGETGRKLKERMDKHKDGGAKSQKDKKKTGLSQHMNNTLHNHSLA